MQTAFKSLDEVRQAIAVLATGNHDALDRLVWTGVFGTDGIREAGASGRDGPVPIDGPRPRVDPRPVHGARSR
jgi:hypothetical protein